MEHGVWNEGPRIGCMHSIAGLWPCCVPLTHSGMVHLALLCDYAQRACRRHGIQRWPRRQLLKLSRAIDQINATTTPSDDVEEPGVGAPPKTGESSGLGTMYQDIRAAHVQSSHRAIFWRPEDAAQEACNGT